MKEKKKGAVRYISAGVVLILLLLNLVYWGTKKTGFYCDELYSYHFVCQTDYPSINGDRGTEVYLNQWHGSDYYMDYFTVDGNEAFDFTGTYESIRQDVHPPLYYLLLEAVCSVAGMVFPGAFTKWCGIGLNIIFYILTLAILYLLSKKILRSRRWAAVVCVLYGACAGAVSTVMFIRMYMVFAFASIFFVWINYMIWERLWKEERQMGIKLFAALFFSTVFGILNHYYFLIFAFFVCLFVWGYAVIRKKFGFVIKYAVVMAGGIGTSFLLWPQMYDNIFSGYRGREAFLSLSVSTDYAGALREYFQIFLGELLGGIGIVFFAVLVWGILENIIGLFWNIKKEKTKESLCWHLERKAFPTKFSFSVRVEGLYMLLTAAAVVLYVLLIAKIAPYREDRYIFNVYPASVLIFVFMAKASVERLENSSFWKKTVLVFMGMLCLSGYISLGVNYLYRGTGEKLEIMGDISAYPFFYVSENRRYRVAGDSAFLARAEYVYPVKPEDISSIPNALEVLEQQTGNSDFKEYVVYIDSEVEESEEALKAAAEMLGTKILEPLLDTEYSKVYLLK